MKKIFLSLLSLFIGLNVMAQTVYFSLGQSKSAVEEGTGVIYGIDLSTPQTVAEVAFTDEAFNYTISHGVLVEDVYYAIIEGGNTDLVSLNCATNTKTEIGNFRFKFDLTDTDRVNILGMTYDKNAKKLYVIADAAFYDEDTDKTDAYHGIFECDLKTGLLTEVSRFYDSSITSKSTDYDFLNTFASDNNGGIYAISILYKGGYIKKLYRIDVATGNISEVGELTDMKTAINSNVALALQDNGKLLYICGTGEYAVSEIDPTNCSMSYFTNSLKKFKHLSTGICFAKSTADGEVFEVPEPQNPTITDNYKVKVVETIGDILGTDPNGCTYKTYSYYNNKNQLVREASYGKLLDENGAPVADADATYQLERYTQYNYNDLGQLSASWTEQYGIFDGMDLAYNESYDRTYYSYDDKGNLILKDCIGENCKYAYEYDEEGNLIKESRLQLDSYDRNQNGDKTDYYVLWTLSYSDFTNGKPANAICDGEFSNYQYHAVYTYDELGNKIDETRTNYSEKNTYRYVWTYEGLFLAKYQEFKWKSTTSVDEDGNPVKVEDWFEELYTEYTPELENPDRVVRHDYVWDEWATTPGWSKNMVYTITESTEFDPAFAPELTITEVEDAPNTLKLSIVPPAYAMTQQVAFDIYRKGLIIGRIYSTDTDAYDAETGTFTFIDSKVANGTYDYWVQTMVMDELGEIVEGKNVAIVQEQTVYTELPGVTNFYISEVIPYTATATDNEGVTTTYTGNYGRITWDAPADEETMKKLGFVRYNVFQDRMKSADNFEADGQACTWDFDFYENTSYDIYIQTVYELGKVNSETKTLTIEIAPKETTYQFACAMNDWGITEFAKIEGKDNKYEVTFDEFTGEFKVYVDKDLFNCYTMGQYDINIENPFVIGADNELVGPDANNPAMCVTENYKNVTFTLTVEEGKLYLYMVGENVGIDAVNAEDGLYNVYNYQGIRVLNNADKDAVKALPAGFYIVNGKKVVIK